MILSMTGYGKAIATFQDKKINVEIKSLNSKALDLSTRIAPLYREKEMEMRQMIQQKVIRGKVDFSIWIEKDEMADAASINIELAKNYYQQLSALASSNNEATPSMTEMMPIILRMPDILVKQDQTEILSEEEWEVARQAIDSALDALVDFRRQEGEALAKKFGEKIDNIEALLKNLTFTPQWWSPESSVVTPENVAWCHKHGIGVVPWTVDSKAEMRRMVKCGVEAIISNYPDRLLEIVK